MSSTDVVNSEPLVQNRNREQKKIRRNQFITSEYGSDDPSPTNHYAAYNPNLDDSDSDSWLVEDERSFRIKVRYILSSILKGLVIIFQLMLLLSDVFTLTFFITFFHLP